MGLAENVARMRYVYHLNAIEINNVLNQLGIRKDDDAEEKAEYHAMTIFNDILPRLGYDVEAALKKSKKEES